MCAAAAAPPRLLVVTSDPASFCSKALKELARGIAASRCLQELDLENKGLSARSMAALGEAILACTSLRRVLLSRNAFGDEGD